MGQFKNLWVVLTGPERHAVRADTLAMVDGALVFAQSEPARPLRVYAPGQWQSVFLFKLNEDNDFHIWEDEDQ